MFGLDKFENYVKHNNKKLNVSKKNLYNINSKYSFLSESNKNMNIDNVRNNLNKFKKQKLSFINNIDNLYLKISEKKKISEKIKNNIYQNNNLIIHVDSDSIKNENICDLQNKLTKLIKLDYDIIIYDTIDVVKHKISNIESKIICVDTSHDKINIMINKLEEKKNLFNIPSEKEEKILGKLSNLKYQLDLNVSRFNQINDNMYRFYSYIVNYDIKDIDSVENIKNNIIILNKSIIPINKKFSEKFFNSEIKKISQKIKKIYKFFSFDNINSLFLKKGEFQSKYFNNLSFDIDFYNSIKNIDFESILNNINDLRNKILPLQTLQEKKEFDKVKYENILSNISKINNDIKSINFNFDDNINIDDIKQYLNSLSFDSDDFASISKKYVHDIIILIDSNNFQKINKIKNLNFKKNILFSQKKIFYNIIEFNKHIDLVFDNNKKIRFDNSIIKSKINSYLKFLINKCDNDIKLFKLNNELNILLDINKNLDTNININNNILKLEKFLKIHEYIKLVNEKDLLVSSNSDINKRINYCNNCIRLFQDIRNIDDNVFSLINKRKILDNNIVFEEQLEKLYSDLNILEIRNKISLFKSNICNLKIHNNNLKISSIIHDLKKQLSKNEDVLNSLISDLDKFKELNNSCFIDIEKCNIKIQMYNDNVIQLDKFHSDMVNIENDILLYSKYSELFHRSKIPLIFLKNKINDIVSITNHIYSKHTKYKLHIDVSNDSVNFYAIRKNDNLTLPIDKLSGFEKITLHLALKTAFNQVSTYGRSSFIIIDEALDCIDDSRFDSVLPMLINIMKCEYSSILLISHRDINSDIIDFNIKIKAFKDYSIIL